MIPARCSRVTAHALLAVALLLAAPVNTLADEIIPKMTAERVVFVIEQGEIEFGFYPEVAPVTCAHIFELITLGLFASNDIFRVDRGFVAQVSDVTSRRLPIPNHLQTVARKNVPLEVVAGVKHHEGVLSMGRFDDPNSGQSSFSMLLGDAPHLDMQYTLFGKITKGMDIVHKLEDLPTKREGIFVMPLQRIEILTTYWYRVTGPLHLGPTITDTSGAGSETCEDQLDDLKLRFESQADELQRVRKKCLPA